MKNPISVIFLVFLFGCGNTTTPDELDMSGVYQMEYQEIDNGNQKNRVTDLRQLKIYTDDYFMYTQANPRDSSYAFGVGTYRVNRDSGIVVEHVIYSASGNNADSSGIEYPLHITTDIDGYTQQIPDIKIRGEDVRLTERYKRSKKQDSTPLDGVWREVEFYTVNGNDTTRVNRTQFKTFYSGYFMWGQANTDSAGNVTTAMGFGSFDMPDKTHLKETDLNSTYAITPGQTFDVEIEFLGNDRYKQTLPNSDGSRNVEVYERMKQK